MSEKMAEIESALVDIMNEVRKPDNTGGPNETVIAASVVVLVGGALVNLQRIADAVEKLATIPIEAYKIGDVSSLKVGLTKEEWETIEALRRGDISTHVTPAKGYQDEGTLRG